MRRAGWVFGVAALGAAILASCLVDNAEYCDAQHKKCPNNQTCNVARFRCEEPTDGGVDAGEDLSLADFAGVDFGGPDFADMARECNTTSQCTDPARPICNTGPGQCRACVGTDDSQCALHAGDNYCDVASGRCVECTPATQATICPSTKPICDTGACRICNSNSECSTGVCKDNGTCAASNEVFYVDNGNQPVVTCKTGGTHDGAMGTPFCDIQDAIGARQYIKVTGHAGFSYGEVSVTSSSYFIIGPGAGVTDPAFVVPVNNGNPAFNLSGSTTASLTVIGMEAGPRTAAVNFGADAFHCAKSGGATLTLTVRKSAAYHAGGFGVSSSSCRINLDGNRIAFNTSGGAYMGMATQYNIINNWIYRNTSTGMFVDAIIPASGFFQFNTVANNTKAAGSGGADCGTATSLLESSIFWGNSVNPTQIGGSCVLVGCDVSTDPKFANEAMDDYSLTSSSTLIDQVMGTVDGGGPLPDHDFFGTHRPLGNGFDVGAHEKK